MFPCYIWRYYKKSISIIRNNFKSYFISIFDCKIFFKLHPFMIQFVIIKNIDYIGIKLCFNC